MNTRTLTLTLLSSLSTLSFSVSAASVGGIDFADNAFVDQLIGSSGNFLNYDSATASDVISQSQLASDLTDSDLNAASTYVLSLDTGAYVDLAFTDNYAFNGTGNDLAFFFAGDASFSISGSSETYTSQRIDGYWITDAFSSYELNVATINLDDLGLAENATFDQIHVLLENGSAALSMVGALNSSDITPVPLPAPFLLFLSGLGALGLFGRRQ